ncbi:MAG: hypothetical protein WC554_06665 [Clostridia bacterium]
MPAKSEAQRRLMALALHSPSKVRKKNKGVLGMDKKSLQDFVKAPVAKKPKNILAYMKGE